MKVFFKNSNLVFQKSTIVEETITKQFTQGDASPLVINLILQNPVKPNTDIEVKVSGTSGIVPSDTWNLAINGIADGTITTNGTKTVSLSGQVVSLQINRASAAQISGQITFSIKYIGDSQYIPNITHEEVVFDSGHQELVFALPESVSAPCMISFRAENQSLSGYGLSVSILDENDTVLGTKQFMTNGIAVALESQSVSVRKVKISRSGSVVTGTFDLEIYLP